MGIVVLKYQDNFADNLSEIAYSKMIENNSKRQCFFENNSKKRTAFENIMSNFRMDYKYISTNQVKSIAEKSFIFSRKMVNPEKIEKEVKSKKGINKIVDINHFKIDDIPLITSSIKEQFLFKNLNFIANFDILDEIKSTNSVGLYINKKDIDNLDLDYIYRAAERLNKYHRKPILYIFSNKKVKLDNAKMSMRYKFINILDWREEFYFLTKCSNKIILKDKYSYSEAFWSVILNENTNLIAFDKKTKAKKAPFNWIGV